jgi:Polyketide cyclase / dehydrase and lipid transport
MGRVTASLQLPFAAETVWRVATRIPDLPKWLPEVVAAESLDAEPSLGSRVRLKMGAAAAGTEIMTTVKSWRPPVLAAIGGSAGPLSIDVRTRLDPMGPDVTRIALEIEISAPPLLGFIGREAERRINAELHPSLQRLRELIEAEAAGTTA